MHQRRQLSKLIAHAARTVPFYKKRLRPDAKLKPEALTQQRWRRIPIARRVKVDVQKAGDAIFSSAPPRNHGHVYTERTSGSLGRAARRKGDSRKLLLPAGHEYPWALLVSPRSLGKSGDYPPGWAKRPAISPSQFRTDRGRLVINAGPTWNVM